MQQEYTVYACRVLSRFFIQVGWSVRGGGRYSAMMKFHNFCRDLEVSREVVIFYTLFSLDFHQVLYLQVEDPLPSYKSIMALVLVNRGGL